MKKVVTIGGATQDVFIKHENSKMLQIYTKRTRKAFLIFEEGSKIEIKNLSYSTGGGATNAASSFSRLGFSVSTIIKMGDDQQAEMIIKKLKKEGVDTSAISKTKELNTGVSIIIPCLSGDRTVLAYRGANTSLQKEDLNEELIASCDQLYITSLSGESSKLLPYITTLAKKHNVPVAINPGISQLAAGAPQIMESLPNIDIFILNAQEATEFMCTLTNLDTKLMRELQNESTIPEQKDAPQLMATTIRHQGLCFSIHQYFQEILKRGPKIVVVTNGKEGVYVATNNKIYFHPSIKTNTVSTLGAGDSFGSCFVASLALGESIEKAIINGVINSSSVIQYLDAKTGLLTLDELAKQAKQSKRKHITIFPL